MLSEPCKSRAEPSKQDPEPYLLGRAERGNRRADPHSDIDLLVDLEPGRSLIDEIAAT